MALLRAFDGSITSPSTSPQVANIKLGLPSTIIHVVKPTSPLYELSLEQMEANGWEIFCFLDGMDPMTSNSLQARHSYRSVRGNSEGAVRGGIGDTFFQYRLFKSCRAEQSIARPTLVWSPSSLIHLKVLSMCACAGPMISG